MLRSSLWKEPDSGTLTSLMMLVAFAAQLVASFVGGGSIAKFGYPVLLAGAAGLAAIAAAGFRSLPAEAVRAAEPPRLFPASAADSAPD